VIVVHSIAKPDRPIETAGPALVICKALEPAEPIPPGAMWIDMIQPTMEEDEKVQAFVGAPVPTKADPDYTEPPEAHYAENGVRYLHALLISEPGDTPDVTGVTFVIAPTALVTVRYHPVESCDLFSQKLCKASGQALSGRGRSRADQHRPQPVRPRASKAGERLEQIGSAVFRAKGDQGSRNRIYSDTVFKGRISGFTMGTGSTLALLPPQNATGNFVKVVQRLPVRIDLADYDPDKSPLFIGTSVVPYVYFNQPPTGPDAGKFLQTSVPEAQKGGSTANPPGAKK
jgi:hypothetical protein